MASPPPLGESRPFEESTQPPENLLQTVVLEDVRGPFFGFYVAAYVVHTRRGFYAYGKLCRGQPESVWDVQRAYAKLSIGPRREPGIAMAEIFQAAEARLSRQPFNRPTAPNSLHSEL